MSRKIPDILFSIFLGLLNLILIVVVWWASYRGFDLSDESFYYLGYRHYANIPDLSAASFHFIYGKFFSFLDLSLAGVRLLRLFLSLLASLILYVGIKKVKSPGAWSERFILFNVILGGMLLSYTWAPMALSYNSMSTIFFACIVGFWLIGISSSPRTKLFCWTILGGFFVLLFFIKISNLLLLPLLWLAVLYRYFKKDAHAKPTLKSSIACTIAFVIGVIGMLIFVSGGITSIPETIDTHLQQ